MKIKLVNGTVYEVSRADIVNGRLEIDFQGQNAEEVQKIFSVPANLQNIELMTDSDATFCGNLLGWTVYAGVLLNGPTKTAILTKEPNVTAERITEAASVALEAKVLAEETAENLNTAITELTMAMAGV